MIPYMDIRKVFDEVTDEMFAISTDTYMLYEAAYGKGFDPTNEGVLAMYKEKHDALIEKAIGNRPHLTMVIDELPEIEREVLVMRLAHAREIAVHLYSKLRDPDCFDLAVATNICLEALRG